MKPLFINGASCISPQPTFGTEFPFEAKEYTGSRLSCIEPDYAPYIDPKLSRRMGRLLKYGTTAGLQALRDAGIQVPDAISTGTGFGLLDDSGKFLKNVIEANEGVVSPTAFIQSTHNTVSSNIALSVSCHAHNNTFAHKGFSFESALVDAQMLATEDDKMANILVGAYDEVTDYSYQIMQRLGLIRSGGESNTELLKTTGRGTIAGEGSAFFVLSTQKAENTYATYRGCKLIYKPSSAQTLSEAIEDFLAGHGLDRSEASVLSGVCGDDRRDTMLRAINEGLFRGNTVLAYKHLCGEYMTSSAFAMWAAVNILRTGVVPEYMLLSGTPSCPQHILICNSYKNDYALILLSVA
ncbi:MAG: beta-ketoacyl synthase chain length factor [Bacteroidetes bacterium]|nr:beta-ketoacyl synthase chain length factor [Bacteroidota bacterium]